jgi:hypothetical protein
MAKLSCNINSKEIEKLVSNSDSEEQCTLSLIHNMEQSDDIVTMNKVWHDRKSENRDMVTQFNISDSALNCTVYLMSYQTRFFII